MKIRFSRFALFELRDIRAYYRMQYEDPEIEFEKSMQEKIDVFKKFPLIYSVVSDPTHKIVMYRFPYHTYDYIAGDFVTIVSIAHQYRKPFYVA